MIERAEHYTPFPPEELWAPDHNMEFAAHHKSDDVVNWCIEFAGERGKDWWLPARRLIVFRNPKLRTLFKLTWG